MAPDSPRKDRVPCLQIAHRAPREFRFRQCLVPSRMRSSHPAPHPWTASQTKLPFAFASTSNRIILRKLLKIWLARIDARKIVLDLVMIGRAVRHRRCTLLDVFRDLGQRGSAVRARKFQAVVRCRIVAGGNVHASVQLPMQDSVRDHRGRCRSPHRSTLQPCDRRTAAEASANSGEKNRVS